MFFSSTTSSMGSVPSGFSAVISCGDPQSIDTILELKRPGETLYYDSIQSAYETLLLSDAELLLYQLNKELYRERCRKADSLENKDSLAHMLVDGVRNLIGLSSDSEKPVLERFINPVEGNSMPSRIPLSEVTVVVGVSSSTTSDDNKDRTTDQESTSALISDIKKLVNFEFMERIQRSLNDNGILRVSVELNREVFSFKDSGSLIIVDSSKTSSSSTTSPAPINMNVFLKQIQTAAVLGGFQVEQKSWSMLGKVVEFICQKPVSYGEKQDIVTLHASTEKLQRPDYFLHDVEYIIEKTREIRITDKNGNLKQKASLVESLEFFHSNDPKTFSSGKKTGKHFGNVNSTAIQDILSTNTTNSMVSSMVLTPSSMNLVMKNGYYFPVEDDTQFGSSNKDKVVSTGSTNLFGNLKTDEIIQKQSLPINTAEGITLRPWTAHENVYTNPSSEVLSSLNPNLNYRELYTNSLSKHARSLEINVREGASSVSLEEIEHVVGSIEERDLAVVKRENADVFNNNADNNISTNFTMATDCSISPDSFEEMNFVNTASTSATKAKKIVVSIEEKKIYASQMMTGLDRLASSKSGGEVSEVSGKQPVRSKVMGSLSLNEMLSVCLKQLNESLNMDMQDYKGVMKDPTRVSNEADIMRNRFEEKKERRKGPLSVRELMQQQKLEVRKKEDLVKEKEEKEVERMQKEKQERIDAAMEEAKKCGPVDEEAVLQQIAQGAGKKACANCSCGRSELEEKYGVEEANRKIREGEIESKCGNCSKGDDYRCEGCPFRGLPAFKPGEKIQFDAN